MAKDGYGNVLHIRQLNGETKMKVKLIMMDGDVIERKTKSIKFLIKDERITAIDIDTYCCGIDCISILEIKA